MQRLLFALSILGPALSGQTTARDQAKENRIVEQLTAVAPGAVDDFKKATAALDRGDWQAAIAGFRRVVPHAPRFSPALRRLGGVLVESGERKQGLELLEQAVAIERTPENLISLAQSLAFGGKAAQSTAAERERAFEMASEALRSPGATGDPSYPVVVAQLGLQLQKLDAFRQALGVLRREHPNLMLTHYFAAIDAGLTEHWTLAEEEIRKAGAMGLPKASVDSFLNETPVGSHARAWRWARYAAYLVGAWVVALLLLVAAGKYLSRRTLRSIEKSDPSATISAAEASLRKTYRGLIDVAGTYYYVSLPVVIFLVLAVAGSVTYGFVLLGRIPIKLVLLLVLGAGITIWKMVQTLFIKPETTDPGRILTKEEAPALWAVADEVAAKIGTRTVDEIRVTPGTEMAVYERGSRRERRQDRAQRILLMGVALFQGFRQSAFRAVLAHEYGHFSQRDTAGGDIALRVNQDMIQFAVAMAQNGQAVWYNVAFQFLRLYHFIFRRITAGATRLQEVLADRVAARLYGPDNFEQGLTHVIRRGLEFQYFAGKEIENAQEAQRPLRNLYTLETPAEPEVEEALKASLSAPTTEDDTHPGPADRFRLVHRVAPAAGKTDEGTVWDLFAHPEGLMQEMHGTIQARLA